MKQSVAGIIYVNERFFLGHRIPSGEMGNRWEFPGGKVDADETPQEAIIREFQEEFELDVSVGELITSVEFTNKQGRVQLLAFIVSIPENVSVHLSEHTEVGWKSFDEIATLNFVDSDKLLLPYLKRYFQCEK